MKVLYITLGVLWYLSGSITCFTHMYMESDNPTQKDIVDSVFVALLGPIVPLLWLVEWVSRRLARKLKGK